MRLDALRERIGGGWVKAAVLTWTVIVSFVCVRAALQPYKRTLYTTWEQAGADWEAGRDLYRKSWRVDQDQFRYSPLTAVLLVPFHYLPLRVGGVVWRILNAAVLLSGFALWLRSAPKERTASQKAILFIIVSLLSLSSLSNGQPNPLVLGLLLLALAAVDRERWSTAAFCVALAAAIKIYPLAIGLLLAVVYPRRFAFRLLLALTLVVMLPFVCQRWDYVYSQYVEWLQRLGKDNRWYWPPHMAYRDLWLLIRLAHLPLTPLGYRIVQLACAAVCAGVCVAMRWRGLPQRDILTAVLMLGTCWMTLCGPATESSTYVLLAPALAWAVHAGESERWPGYLRWPTRLAFLLFAVCLIRAIWPNVNRVHGLGLQPQGALLLSLVYLVVFARALARFRDDPLPRHTVASAPCTVKRRAG
jgi:hypothetical protein